jgi:hypothetical protein
MWIHHIKEKFLKSSHSSVLAWTGSSLTHTPRNVKQMKLPYDKRKHSAILQISVAYECLIFQDSHADGMPELLRQSLRDENTMFCSTVVDYVWCMLRSTINITISSTHDLHRTLQNPTKNFPPTLFSLLNAYLGTYISE